MQLTDTEWARRYGSCLFRGHKNPEGKPEYKQQHHRDSDFGFHMFPPSFDNVFPHRNRWRYISSSSPIDLEPGAGRRHVSSITIERDTATTETGINPAGQPARRLRQLRNVRKNKMPFFMVLYPP
jgi:hypothetical protein